MNKLAPMSFSETGSDCLTFIYHCSAQVRDLAHPIGYRLHDFLIRMKE